MTTVRIEIKGVLEERWNESFDELKLSYKNKNTILSGQVEDQSAFHGILNKIRDFNLTLISVSSDLRNIY